MRSPPLPNSRAPGGRFPGNGFLLVKDAGCEHHTVAARALASSGIDHEEQNQSQEQPQSDDQQGVVAATIGVEQSRMLRKLFTTLRLGGQCQNPFCTQHWETSFPGG